MAKSSKSDEMLVAALVECGTIRDAAKAVKISERQFYERMKSGEFRNLYNNAKADLLRSAVFNVGRNIQTALDTIVQVMQDEKTNPATRLQAAQTILNSAGKLQDHMKAVDDSAMCKPPSPLLEALDDLII